MNGLESGSEDGEKKAWTTAAKLAVGAAGQVIGARPWWPDFAPARVEKEDMPAKVESSRLAEALEAEKLHVELLYRELIQAERVEAQARAALNKKVEIEDLAGTAWQKAAARFLEMAEDRQACACSTSARVCGRALARRRSCGSIRTCARCMMPVDVEHIDASHRCGAYACT